MAIQLSAASQGLDRRGSLILGIRMLADIVGLPGDLGYRCRGGSALSGACIVYQFGVNRGIQQITNRVFNFDLKCGQSEAN